MLSHRKSCDVLRRSVLSFSLMFGSLTFTWTRLAGQEPAPVTESRHTDSRSPVLAGALSFFVFPGVGSYYAGDTRHGTTHVVVGVASIGVAYAGAANCDIFGECPGAVAILAGFGAYVINTIWSTVAAVQDANAYNARSRRFSLNFDPRVEVLSGNEVDLGGGYRPSAQRYGVRLLRLDL